MAILLVLDDNKEVVKSVLGLFKEEYEYNILAVTDIKTAMSMVSKQRFDVVISALEMPTANEGTAFLKYISTLDRRPKVILMTQGSHDIDIQLRDICLQRPFTGTELRDAVRSLLNMK